MRTVHRFPLEIKDGIQPVQWRKGGEIRLVGQKNQEPIEVGDESGIPDQMSFIDLFVEIDTDIEDFETRHFSIVGTGNPIPQGGEYLGSVIQRSERIFGGALVWHVYEHNI